MVIPVVPFTPQKALLAKPCMKLESMGKDRSAGDCQVRIHVPNFGISDVKLKLGMNLDYLIFHPNASR